MSMVVSSASIHGAALPLGRPHGLALAAALAVVACGDDGGTGGGTGGGAPQGQGGAGGGAAAPFCDARSDAALCEDFDGSTLPGPFAEQRATGATLSIVDTSPVSAPSCLSIETDGAGAVGQLVHPVQASRITVAFQLRLDRTPGGDTTARLVTFGVSHEDGTEHIGLEVDTSGRLSEISVSDDGGKASSSGPLDPLAVGAWTPVELVLEYGGSAGGVVTMNVGGKSGSTTFFVGTAATPSLVELGLVADFAGWGISIDDVVVDAT